MNNYPDVSQRRGLTLPITSLQVRDLIKHMDSVIDLSKLQDSTPFSEAGADSLDLFNIISEIQMATGVNIADEDVEQVSTLTGLVTYLNTKLS